MFYGAYISAEGAQAQSRRLEVLANNLANVDTAGFKRDLAVVRARHAEEIDLGLDSPGSGSINNVGGGVRLVETKTDFSPGPLAITGEPTDLAIEGDGFFAVQTAAGERYTRNGGFQINANGQLVTNEGMPVLGDNGPIVLQPTDRNIMISKDGRITVNEGADTRTEGFRGRIRVVRFERPHDLIKEGASTFRAPAGLAALIAWQLARG